MTPDPANRACARPLRVCFRLILFAGCVESPLLFVDRPREKHPMNKHRYQEVIAGRVYHIEAARVNATKWRAQIIRIPGMPTALMPVYGTTPEEAAKHLAQWLARAHGTPSPAV